MTPKAIEQASPDVREVLEDAFHKAFGYEPNPTFWPKQDAHFAKFRRFLNAEAYTDAALMLVPEGLYPTIDFVNCRVWLRTADNYDLITGTAYGFEQTVPLGLAAASLRAKGPGHEQ